MQMKFGKRKISQDEYDWAYTLFAKEFKLKHKSEDYDKAVKLLLEVHCTFDDIVEEFEDLIESYAKKQK